MKFEYHDLKLLKEFEDIEKIVNEAKIIAKSLGLNPGDNVHLLCHSLYYTRNETNSFVECGVYKGNTLFTAKLFADLCGIKKQFIGLDTFSGFPNSANENDKIEKFKQLYEQGRITLEHYNKAKKRTTNQEEYLTSGYFSNVDLDHVLKLAEKLEVSIMKGKFADILPQVSKIDVLHLDCDLYTEYQYCLNTTMSKLQKDSIIVLDEYYSHKYPGARIAVDEFLMTNNLYSLNKCTTDEFERWFLLRK